MKRTANPFAPVLVGLNPQLRLPVIPVMDVERDVMVAAELRLHRLYGECWSPTSAAIRIPAAKIREVGEALLQIADGLGL
jgi:hypothetical protein